MNKLELELELEQENAELKAENERLKEEFEIESLTDNTTGEITYRSNVALRLANETNHLTAKCVKYKTCLQEIKDIVENNCWDYTDVTVLAVKDKILQLIKKAEVENEIRRIH